MAEEMPPKLWYQFRDLFTRQDELMEALVKIANRQLEVLSTIAGVAPPSPLELKVGMIGLSTEAIEKGKIGNAWFNGVKFEVKALEEIDVWKRVIVVEEPNFILEAEKVVKPRELTRTTTLEDISAAALSKTTTLKTKFRLVAVLVHLSAAASPTITVTLDSKGGADYDTILDEQTLSSNTDYAFLGSDGEMEFEDGDQIKVDVSSVAATAGLTIITEELP